jgi:pimeloyl-ACP methyl ester carboxylesterase
MDVLWVGLATIIGLLVAAFVVEAVAERRDRRRFPPKGALVDIGGRGLHLKVQGKGQPGPTVILDSGMVSFSSNWTWVQPEVAKVAPVVAYDRAGLGWSDPAPQPRDAGQSARELHAALQASAIRGPYVLAGHSSGGLAARAFAALYRDEVAGMVMVDGSIPINGSGSASRARSLDSAARSAASLPDSGCSALSTGSTSCSPMACRQGRGPS